MRRAAVSEANRRHCPERSERIAEAIAKPVAARPEQATATRRCEGVARSNLVWGSGNSFEIASLRSQ